EFTGFNDITKRIRFGTNLESRGTDGTLILFETAENNYNTVKLFSEINKTVYTCSIATMVYEQMPNSTDFSNFKDVCQGLNMANINGGENYHTQNDAPENVGVVYLSQQGQIVEAIIEKLGSYDLDLLYDAEESAVFFSYLDTTTVVYSHAVSTVLAVIAIVLIVVNVILSAAYRRQNNIGKTVKGIIAIVIGFILSAAAAYACYYLFQLIAVLSGAIDIHMVGTITYSNTVIVIGLSLLALAMTVLTTHFACKWFRIERRDMTRAFAYIHAFLGIVLSFVLADASYLFIFSSIMLMLNELFVTLAKKRDFAACHFELLATALYFPIVIPVIFLATSALGMTMAYVYGLVFAIALFGFGICIAPVCAGLSVPAMIRRKKGSAAGGAVSILVVALVLFLVVSLGSLNASVNLQGKQNIAKLPYDDALVYVENADGSAEYRVYDLNAYSALKKYAPDMEYAGEYYAAAAEKQDFGMNVLATAEGNVLTVKKNAADSLAYVEFRNTDAASFTVDDGITVQTYMFSDMTADTIKLHSDCVITIDGSADVIYKEVFRDFEGLIPAEYANDTEKLHFNLWLEAEFKLG
ncbi:MAG: hypothetical protein IJA26_03515, partial [Clostridia bacterium]|nr:hypothetical protein [Clostridia bacterium]